MPWGPLGEPVPIWRGGSGRAVTTGTVERIEGLLGWREITVSDRSEATQVVLIDPELTLTVSCRVAAHRIQAAAHRRPASDRSWPTAGSGRIVRPLTSIVGAGAQAAVEPRNRGSMGLVPAGQGTRPIQGQVLRLLIVSLSRFGGETGHQRGGDQPRQVLVVEMQKQADVRDDPPG